MKDSPLRKKFRNAVLGGIAALSLISALNSKASPGSTTVQPATNTQLIMDSCPADPFSANVNVDWLQWENRQDLYLTDDSNSVRYERWLSKLDGMEDMPLVRQAQIADSLVNKTVAWTSDSANYKAKDYWAAGAKTILTGKGDCDDFAIAKFYALQYLGVPDSRLTILVVATDSVSKKLDHAVLAVDTTADNNWTNCLILDNRSKKVKSFGRTGYAPLYAVNPGEIRGCAVKKTRQPAPGF